MVGWQSERRSWRLPRRTLSTLASMMAVSAGTAPRWPIHHSTPLLHSSTPCSCLVFFTLVCWFLGILLYVCSWTDSFGRFLLIPLTASEFAEEEAGHSGPRGSSGGVHRSAGIGVSVSLARRRRTRVHGAGGLPCPVVLHRHGLTMTGTHMQRVVRRSKRKSNTLVSPSAPPHAHSLRR